MNTKLDDSAILAILKIGHDTSMRGEGISMHDALIRTRYKDLRTRFSPKDLYELIKKHPIFVEQWILYSEDKRTTGGWYLLRDGEIGKINDPASRIRFDSLEQAVAEYVIRELDVFATR